MKNNRLTITIGIPAYNEELNIIRLLKVLLSQKNDNFVLDKIIVISDGSKDGTVQESKKINNKKLLVIANNKRGGLTLIQNQIIGKTKSDILVILNADTLPKNNEFLNHLIKPFYLDSNTGIVSARVKSLKPNTFIGKVLANSHDFKQSIFQRLNDGNNIYLCHGSARAFSKDFYKNLRWPYNCPEDAYSYIICIEKGFKFKYAKDAVVYFSPSSNISDHIKQSTRFFHGKKTLERLLGFSKIKHHYKIPALLTSSFFVIYLAKKPVLTLGFFFILLLTRLLSISVQIDHSRIDASNSTKELPI